MGGVKGEEASKEHGLRFDISYSQLKTVRKVHIYYCLFAYAVACRVTCSFLNTLGLL